MGKGGKDHGNMDLHAVRNDHGNKGNRRDILNSVRLAALIKYYTRSSVSALRGDGGSAAGAQAREGRE